MSLPNPATIWLMNGILRGVSASLRVLPNGHLGRRMDFEASGKADATRTGPQDNTHMKQMTLASEILARQRTAVLPFGKVSWPLIADASRQ